MRFRVERGGVVFEYERKPMKEGRFRILCLLAAAGMYAGMVAAVTALCGIAGLGITLVMTFLIVMIIGAACDF